MNDIVPKAPQCPDDLFREIEKNLHAYDLVVYSRKDHSYHFYIRDRDEREKSR
ncbi:MAG: hypothetical protein KatS3mg080_0869 [Anoxybacillus sp.]|nr:MAG: hypothetical protein KatS3mg080_0869 [Anoxybacillus sp.]